VGEHKARKLTIDEAKPKLRAAFYAKVDTGCMKSCMSEEFSRQHPEPHDKDFRPTNAYGRAVNEAKVLEVGIARHSFRINKVHICMNFRIARGLIHPLSLGWNFRTKPGWTLQEENFNTSMERNQCL
jgi:hypothetical protein